MPLLNLCTTGCSVRRRIRSCQDQYWTRRDCGFGNHGQGGVESDGECFGELDSIPRVSEREESRLVSHGSDAEASTYYTIGHL